MKELFKKKPESWFAKTCLIGFGLAILMLIIGLATGWCPWSANVDGVKWHDFGLAVGMWAYEQSFLFDFVQDGIWWSNQGGLYMAVVVVTMIALVAFILLLVLFIKKKDTVGIVASCVQFLLVVMLGWLFDTVVFGVDATHFCDRHAYFVLGMTMIFLGVAFLAVTALIIQNLFERYMAERHPVVETAPAAQKPVEEEKPVEEAKPEEKPTEEEKPAPAIVAPAEPVVVPAPVVDAKGKNYRRASFETKLKKSDEDLRHKYYDLRDYIKSYGVHNRISIPGDTFSAHRVRYAFITVAGKHLRINLCLDPKKYDGTTIPVDANTAKKFDDLPLVFKVKSDLSFRRAEQLIDDLMAQKGIAKPEPKK